MPLLWVDSSAIINVVKYNTTHVSTQMRYAIEPSGSIENTLLWVSLITGNITVDGNGGYLHQPAIDRTQSCNMPYLFDTSRFQMPVLIFSKDTFLDVCARRAQQIKAIADKQRKQIVIMYSGGVDSTCIICAFILVFGEQFVRDNIVLMMNNDSIEENQQFYNDFIVGKIRTINSNNFNTTIDPTQYVIVTGDPGGALEGGGVLRTILVDYRDSIDSPSWKDQIRKYHSKLFVTSLYNSDKLNYADYFIQSIEHSAASRGLSITNLFDCFWWYLINFKWMSMSLNIYKNCRGVLEANRRGIDFWFEHVIPFYGSDEFVLWSYSNRQHMLNLRCSMPWPAYYKRAFKDVIYLVNHDSDYLNYKGKDARLRRAISPGQSIFALTNDMAPII